MRARLPSNWVRPLAYASVYIGWGTTYLAIRVGVQHLGPASFLMLRFSAAALLLAPVLLAGRAWKGMPLRELGASALQGALLLAGGLLLMATGEKTVPSGAAAIVVGCAPVGFAIFDRLLNGTRLRAAVALGTALGIGGVAMLGRSNGAQGAIDSTGMAFVVAGCMLWCFASVLSKKLPLVRNALLGIFCQYAAASVLLAALAFWTEGFRFAALAACGHATLLSLAYIAVLPSLVSYTGYMWLLAHEPNERVSTYAFVNPVVAVVAGALVLGESVSPRVVAALALVIAGTWLNFRKPRSARPAGTFGIRAARP